MKKKIDWFALLAIVLITELTGLLSGLLSANAGQSYQQLRLPPLAPPGWLFGVVWPILYLLMALGAYLVYRSPPSPQRTRALGLYWGQLLVNFLWPILFFRLEAQWLAVAAILLLDVLVAATAAAFYKIDKRAGYLLLPYLIWLLFASYLNIAVALGN